MSEKSAVEPMDPNKKNSVIAGPIWDEPTAIVDKASGPRKDGSFDFHPSSNTCHWNDVSFPEGALVENEGVTYECHFGKWIKKN